MNRWDLDEEKRQVELTLEESLTIENVTQFKQSMLKAFNEADQVLLNLEDVTEIDVAGLQILCACYRFGIDHNKQLHLRTGDNTAFAEIARETGFTQWAIRTFGEKATNLLRDEM